MESSRPLLPWIFLLLGACLPAGAAEFSLEGPSVELRRIQPCAQCGRPLVVTHLLPGTIVCCPACGAEQARLPNDELRVQVLQICPVCQSAMDVHELPAGTRIRCDLCGAVQRVVPAATLSVPAEAGGGRPPGVLFSTAAPPSRSETPFHAAAALDSTGAVPEAGVVPGAPPTSLAVEALPPDRPEPLPAPIRKPLPEPPLPAGESAAVDVALDRAALVNGRPILMHEVETRLSYVIDEARSEMGPAAATLEGREMISRLMPKLKRRALEELIDTALVLQAAEAEGVAALPDEVDRIAEGLRLAEHRLRVTPEILEQARKEAIVERMMERHALAPLLAPREVRAWYEEHPERVLVPVTVRFRSVVVFTERAGRADLPPAGVIGDGAAARGRATGDVQAGARQYCEDA
ncbi:MAG: SurA N-terminal domain-containing protein, partial [Planctomycetota bacterium]